MSGFDHAARLRRLRELLIREHLDALLVSSLPNARYLSAFSGSNALLLVTQRRSVLLTDYRYQAQTAEECPAEVEARIETASLWTGLWSLLAADPNVKTVGVDGAHLTYKDFERCREQGGRWNWRSTPGLVEELRVVKDAAEVQAIRVAGVMAMRALTGLLPQVRAGLTEREISGLLERELRKAGSEAHPFPAIVASGERSALPHARPGGREVRRGDLLLLDFGATSAGYVSDVTRTFVLGPPSDRQAEIHLAVSRAREAAVAALKAGMTGKEGDRLARDVIEHAGFGDLFGHGLGHGIGLEVHEDPRMSRLSDAILAEGTVVTIEPGVYSPGFGGVRLEDDAYVTARGVELLTEFPRELQVIG